jgi:hypothetical protein
MADDVTQLILDIITKAQENKAQPFRDILYWSEYRYYKGLARSTKIVLKVLYSSADNLFKNYCKDVIAGISDVTKLLAYEQLLDIAEFYERDLETIQSMLIAYKKYLEDGNFWYSFFGGRRES